MVKCSCTLIVLIKMRAMHFDFLQSVLFLWLLFGWISDSAFGFYLYGEQTLNFEEGNIGFQFVMEHVHSISNF